MCLSSFSVIACLDECLYASLSVCTSVRLSLVPWLCMSLFIFVCLCIVCLSVCPSLHAFISHCLFGYLHVYLCPSLSLALCLFLSLSISSYLFMSISICMSLFVSVCLFMSLWLCVSLCPSLSVYLRLPVCLYRSVHGLSFLAVISLFDSLHVFAPYLSYIYAVVRLSAYLSVLLPVRVCISTCLCVRLLRVVGVRMAV